MDYDNYYQSPYSDRYLDHEMSMNFSNNYRHKLWRMLWIVLANAEKEFGLSCINEEMIVEMTKKYEVFDYDRIKEIEKSTHHDVMAHLKYFGEICPISKGIMHLGATSCYITDNAELIMNRDALKIIRTRLVELMDTLADKMLEYYNVETIGYTHFQPAQMVTVGKRFAMWCQDILMDHKQLLEVFQGIKFLGCRGAVGSEDSFMSLFDNDQNKVIKINTKIANFFGFESLYEIVTQTYPRKIDIRIADLLASIATSLYRMMQDIRLLQHDQQLREYFDIEQIGSSAMPYKQNPINCENICGIARSVIVDSMNAKLTYTSQWLERTLDDSSNKRIVTPQMFIAVSYILDKANSVIKHIGVNKPQIQSNIDKHMHYLLTERIIMELSKKCNIDRQKIHKDLRDWSITHENSIPEDLFCYVESLYPNVKIDRENIRKNLSGRCSTQAKCFGETIKYLIDQKLL